MSLHGAPLFGHGLVGEPADWSWPTRTQAARDQHAYIAASSELVHRRRIAPAEHRCTCGKIREACVCDEIRALWRSMSGPSQSLDS